MRLRGLLAGGVLLALTLLSGGGSRAAEPSRKGCEEGGYRQFDFWIGDWEVFQPDGKKAGENRITSIAGGCALLEAWTGRGGFSGNSLNRFDKDDKQWHQSWIDSMGGRLELAGGIEAGAMVMSSTSPHPDRPGITLMQRISWSKNADGSVRQLWQNSEDGGRSWNTVFDGRYVHKQP
jgi:hypothetical protein